MHRFFVPPDAIGAGAVTVTGPQARQIRQVLRLRRGEHVVFLDDSGWQYEAELTATDATVTARVIARTLVATEPRTKITLYQGLVRGPRFDVILQKCTELGVVAFVPVICARSVVGLVGDEKSGKPDRWLRIVTEAAEQTGRGKIPIVRPAMLFNQACEHVRGLGVIPWEAEQSTSLRATIQSQLGADAPRPGGRPFSISVFIGPEGGFTDAEIETARGYGVESVTLGPRVLRAETAAIVATTIILAETGDLG